MPRRPLFGSSGSTLALLLVALPAAFGCAAAADVRVGSEGGTGAIPPSGDAGQEPGAGLDASTPPAGPGIDAGSRIPPAPVDGGIGSGKDAGGPSAADAAPPTGDASPGIDAAAPPLGALVHPGVLVSASQLAFLKASIAGGAAPWSSAIQQVNASAFGKTTYTPAPVADVDCGSYSNPDIGCTAEKADASAAYTQALLFALTGNSVYATNAIAILNAWAKTLTKHTNSNAPLQAAWTGSVFPRAAEILRYTNSGWAVADIAAFESLLRTAFLPLVENGSGSNGNWELSMAEATIAIGVFLDDTATFQKGVALWKRRVPAYVYLTTDGATPVPPPVTNGGTLTKFWYNQTTYVDGLSQETCRDLGHVQYGLAAMINGAETAHIQGVDLYGGEAKRISAALEFHAQYLNGTAVPSWLCGGSLTAVTPDPMWEIGYNEFANRLGGSLPETAKLLTKIRPTGTDHHMDWETLTHAEVGTH